MPNACRWALLGLLLPTMSVAKPGFRLSESTVAAEAALIDAALQLQLQKLHQRSPNMPVVERVRAGDAVFLRRACIDLAGRLPEPEEVRVFLADPATDKRARLVDRLLIEDGSDDWRFQRLADVLRVKDEVLGEPQVAFIEWLKAEMRAQTPFDKLLRKMLTAQGSVESSPATGLLLRDAGQLRVTASELARALLGVDLHCAHCHDHPFSGWTQMEMTQFAACFGAVKVSRSNGVVQMREEVKVEQARRGTTILPAAKPVGQRQAWREVERQAVRVGMAPGQLWPYAALTPDPWRELKPGEALRVEANPGFEGLPLPDRYAYRDGKAGELVGARILRWHDLHWHWPIPRSGIPQAKPGREESEMEQLAAWWTERANPQFTAATALRVWTWLFGPVRYAAQETWQESASARVSAVEAVRQNSCDSPPHSFFSMDPLDEKVLRGPWLLTLTGVMQRCGLDLRELQRVLARTEAYQLEAVRPQPNADVPLPAPQIRRLPAEVVWDQLVRWLPAVAEEVRSIDLPQVPAADHPLRVLGRGSREWADESLPIVSFAAARFFQGDSRVYLAAENLALLCGGAMGLASPDRQVETLYLTVLGLLPHK